jgi:hypothetical protein
VAWIPAGFDHSGVTGTCSTCHNGATATGKPPTHVATTAQCDSCHSTTAWIPAGFDHSAVTGTCSTCHNGATATGKPPTHIATTAQCDNCHSTTAWIPAGFDHSIVTGSCSTCHNGTTATGKPVTHFGTTLQCDECHSTTAWIPFKFTHSSPDYPGNHSGGVLCIDCHQSNNQTATWTFGAYKPDCAGCHAGNFKPDPHKKYEVPTTARYTVSELRDCSGACHIYTDSSLTTVKESRSGQHRTSHGGW